MKKLGNPRMSLRETAGQPCLRSGSSGLTWLRLNFISPHFIYLIIYLFICLFIHLFISRWRTLLSVDDLVEEVITTLDAGKLLNNTYVIFSSDNGFHLGKRYFIHILISISFSARMILFFNSLRQGKTAVSFRRIVTSKLKEKTMKLECNTASVLIYYLFHGLSKITQPSCSKVD